jgi:hypothetical protein
MAAVNYGAKASVPQLETTIPSQIYYELPSVGSVTGFNRVTTMVYPLASEKQVVSSGGNTIRFRLNTQRNLWIDPTRFTLEFTLKKLGRGHYVDPRCGMHGMIQQYSLTSMGQIIEDVREYNTLAAWQLRFFSNPRTNNGIMQMLSGVGSEGDLLNYTGRDRPYWDAVNSYWVNSEAPGLTDVSGEAAPKQGLRPDVSAAIMRANADHRYCIPIVGSGLFGVNSKFLPTEIFRDLDFVFTLADPQMFIKQAGNSNNSMSGTNTQKYISEYTLADVMLRVDYISLPEAINAQLQSTFARGNRITMRLPAFSVTQQSLHVNPNTTTQNTTVITDTLSSVRAVYVLYKQSRNKEYYYVGTHYHFTEPGKSASALNTSGFRWFQLQNGPAMIPNNPVTDKNGLLCLLNDAIAGSVQANVNIDPYESAVNGCVFNEYGDYVGFYDDQLVNATLKDAGGNSLTFPLSTSGGKFMLACPLTAYNAANDVLVGQRVDHDLYIHTRWDSVNSVGLNYMAFYILAYDRIVSAGVNGISTMQ